MHPPVRWNFLSDGQPDNNPTLPFGYGQVEKIQEACVLRGPLFGHLLNGSSSCVCYVCGDLGIMLKPWHLGVYGGQRNLEIIQSKIQSSLGEDIGQEN